MIYVMIKKVIAVVLIPFILFFPVKSVAAANEATLIMTEIGEVTTTLTGYEAVKEVAKRKASILTTMYGSTSVQYALIDNGKIEVSGQAGVYSKTKRISLHENHMFGIGSISKMFTCASVMKLVEEGKINLEEPITTYIKEFKMADERYQKITPRMLLNHSSGLMGSTFHNAILFDDNDTYAYDNLLEELSNQRLKAEPGAFSVYSNDGFGLAEILVEKVSGISFTEYIRTNFANQLGMNNTKTPMDEIPLDRLAKVYLPGESKELPTDSINMIGTGGIYSTAEDLCRFSQIFMKDSLSVLSENSTKAMENKEYLKGMWPEDGDSVLGYGLGWDSVNTYPFNKYDIKALSKGGDTLLYHGNLMVLPEYNMGIAVLSSGGASTYNQIMAQEILLTALKEKGIISKIIEDKSFDTPVKEVVPVDMKKYEGYYGTLQGVFKVKIEGNKLVITNPTSQIGNEQKFTYTKDKIFVSSGGKNYADLKFVKEKNGSIYIQNRNYSLATGLGQTASIFYVAEKLPSNEIAREEKKAWINRNEKEYYVINEKYTSQIYATLSVVAKIIMDGSMSGYYSNSTIIDKNNCKTMLQIPGMHGRDVIDYHIFIKDKKEYVEAGSTLLLAKKSMKSLNSKPISTYTIKKDGYALWYTIDAKSAGKKMHVKLPKESAFAVYDKEGGCINFSYISGNDEVNLPENGLIVFIGKKGAKFKVQIN